MYSTEQLCVHQLVVPGVGWFQELGGSRSWVVPGVGWFQELGGSRSWVLPGVGWFQELGGSRSWVVPGVGWFQELGGSRSWAVPGVGCLMFFLFTAVVVPMDEFKDVVPVVSDASAITPTSIPISFRILPEQEVNGEITRCDCWMVSMALYVLLQIT